MAVRRRNGGGNGLDAWPGYVDALSTLLMVIIFVLLVFVLAQAFLGVALSGREQALDRVNRQLAELSDMLALERGRSAELGTTIAGLTRDLKASAASRDDLMRQLSLLGTTVTEANSQRDSLRAERDRLTAQLSDANTQAQSTAAQIARLRADLATGAGRLDAASQEAVRAAGDLAEAKRLLAERDATIKANQAAVDARLATLMKLDQQTRALAALRDELTKQAANAAAQATTEAERRAALEKLLADEKTVGDSARAQIALLGQQVAQLRAQLSQVSRDLDLAQSAMADKDVQITNLGSRLNAALASKVEELQRYRSEFFGRLREVLANRPGIQVVGDRFVFQSEVLFPAGSAEMTAAGQNQMRALAGTIKQIATEIPVNLPWILRVDGHADSTPVTGGAFASNWELSAERAIVVVKLLIEQGVPASHLAATGFADNQPLDPAGTAEAFAKNRRIEVRLTDR